MTIGWRWLGRLGASTLLGLLAAGSAAASACAAASAVASVGQGLPETVEADDYTRYELLAPDSAQFRILYEVTATRPGATAYFNPIRKGSEASRETVRDRASGKSLELAVVSGEEARRGGMTDAQLDMSYLRIRLPRPVPAGGGVRLLIDKTYKDPKSYYRQGADRIVFARSLGIRRNAVVLPAGWELVSCNVPAQVLTEPDGRLGVSFMHTGPDAASLRIEAGGWRGRSPPPRPRLPVPRSPPGSRRRPCPPHRPRSPSYRRHRQ